MTKKIKYSEQFKQKAIDLYLKSDLSATKVAREFGIHEHTLCTWVNSFKKGKTESLHLMDNFIIHPTESNLDLDFSAELLFIQDCKKHIDILEEYLLKHKK